ncbi:protein SFI1 [Paragonimus westermani]|uniref:Protein SFI1 n=1 Tax=Paragonimus westermani TaxID=34504 RepID=A0A5J4NLV5_9TREM|nr:protein SFI1 [Paragonimus westermani]
MWPPYLHQRQTTVVGSRLFYVSLENSQDENLIGIPSMKCLSMDAVSNASGTGEDLFVPEDKASSGSSKKAEEVHRRRIMCRAFTAMKTFMERRGEKRALRLTADLFSRNQILLRCIDIWSFRCFTQSVAYSKLFGAARAHHRRHLLRSCFDCWLTRIHKMKQAKSTRELADQYRAATVDKRLLVQIIHSWMQTTSDLLRAQQFHRVKLLSYILNHWRERTRLHGEYRWSHRLATLYDLSKTRRHWFTVWRSELAWYQEHRAEAEQFLWRNRLRNSFRVWLAWSRRSKSIHLGVDHIQIRKRNALLRMVWATWIARVFECHENEAIAVAHCDQRKTCRLKTVFRAWYSWAMRTRQHSSLVAEFRSSVSKTHCHTIFMRWHALASAHVAERTQTLTSFQSARVHLRLLMLRCSLTQWKCSLNAQQKQKLAESFASKNLLKRSLQKWQNLRIRISRKQHLVKVADHFRQVTLKVHCLTVWSKHYRESSHLRRLDAIALLRWSWRLQARVWLSWRRWVVKKRMQRIRIDAAHERHRQRVAREALRTWITRVLDERHQRQTQLCHTFWNSDLRLFRIVSEAAIHWYWWTIAKRKHQPKNSDMDPIHGPAAISLAPFTSLSEICLQNAYATCRPIAGSLDDTDSLVTRVPDRPKPHCPDFLTSQLEAEGLLSCCNRMDSSEPMSSLPIVSNSSPGLEPSSHEINSKGMLIFLLQPLRTAVA